MRFFQAAKLHAFGYNKHGVWTGLGWSEENSDLCLFSSKSQAITVSQRNGGKGEFFTLFLEKHTPCLPSVPRMTDESVIEMLWDLSLSDHLGDVAEAITPILKRFGLPTLSLPALHEELKKRDLRPDSAREDV